MEFPNPYLSVTNKMNSLERWILINSYIYYELNDNVVSDKVFDANSKQLLELIKKNKTDFKASQYYYAFKNFDGNTGFDLFTKLKKDDKIRIVEYSHLALRLSNN